MLSYSWRLTRDCRVKATLYIKTIFPRQNRLYFSTFICIYLYPPSITRILIYVDIPYLIHVIESMQICSVSPFTPAIWQSNWVVNSHYQHHSITNYPLWRQLRHGGKLQNKTEADTSTILVRLKSGFELYNCIITNGSRLSKCWIRFLMRPKS